MTDITQWPKIAKQLILEASSDEELVDIAGDLNSVTNQLGELKRQVAAEVPSDTRGSKWRYYIPGMKAKRTYNNSSLLAKMQEDVDDSLVHTLRWAIDNGLLKLEWQYAKLDKWAKVHGIEITRTTAREVYDGDEYDIGEIWSPQYPKYEAVTDGD